MNDRPPERGRARRGGPARWTGLGFLAGGVLGFLVTLAYLYFR